RTPMRRAASSTSLTSVSAGGKFAALVDRFGHLGLDATGRSPRKRSACAIVAEDSHMDMSQSSAGYGLPPTALMGMMWSTATAGSIF
ncbi:MAG: hypothetical protein WBW99_23715, partial [Pseudolabrys sp.]